VNELPTSVRPSAGIVNRLRVAAATIIRDSREFKRLLKDAGARIVLSEHNLSARRTLSQTGRLCARSRCG